MGETESKRGYGFAPRSRRDGSRGDMILLGRLPNHPCPRSLPPSLPTPLAPFLSETGHQIMQERPAETAALITAWVKRWAGEGGREGGLKGRDG